MTSDSGLSSQDTDYARYIQEVLSELHQMQQTPRLVTSPEELEALSTRTYIFVQPCPVIPMGDPIKTCRNFCPGT